MICDTLLFFFGFYVFELLPQNIENQFFFNNLTNANIGVWLQLENVGDWLKLACCFTQERQTINVSFCRVT